MNLTYGYNAIASGVTFVTAAGNSNLDACTSSPARVPAAIAVGATTSADACAEYSNFGSCLDLFAPGSNITAANRGAAEIFLDGISQGVIDLYTATTSTRQVLFTRALGAGTHTLQINVLGTRNAKATAAYIDVDGFLTAQPDPPVAAPALPPAV